MKRIDLLIILFFYSSLLLAQEVDAEEAYQNCLYSSLPNNGVLFKKYNKEFERHLIKTEVLKDSTPKAYFELFKVLGTKEWRKIKYNYSYIDSIIKVADYKTLNANEKCAKVMREHKSFKHSKYINYAKFFGR